MPDRRVLMLCYHFPPANNGGVERSKKFADYLPAFGWQAHVLTTNLHGKAAEQTGITYASEPLSIYRRWFKKKRPAQNVADKSEIAAVARPNQFFRKWLIPDVQIGWAMFAFAPALRLIRREHIDVIYSTSPPASAHLLALALKLLTRKRWVMDLRDPWTIEPINEYLRGSGVRLSIERRLERLCFRRADAVILNTPQAEDRYRALYPQFAAKMQTIANGYDDAELQLARQFPALPDACKPIPPGALVISHAGAFSRQGGDASTPRLFLDALKALQDEGLISAETCRIIFAGSVSPSMRAMIAQLGLEQLIDLPGTINHLDALHLMLCSDVLLLYDPGDDGTTYVRGKLYEYLASAKPILALVPDGANRELLLQSGRALLAYPDNPTSVRQALEVALSLEASPSPNAHFDLTRYERKTLTHRLAAYLDKLITQDVGK